MKIEKTEIVTIIVLDYASGTSFTTTIEFPEGDDMEEYAEATIEELGFRPKDCYWMEYSGILKQL